ncbi:hypothetical protein EE612_056403, partial [Oryza sativa]
IIIKWSLPQGAMGTLLPKLE